MTRRRFLTMPLLGAIQPALGAANPIGNTAQSAAEGFIFTETLQDGGDRGYFAVGTIAVMMPTDSHALPSTERLIGSRVVLSLKRAD